MSKGGKRPGAGRKKGSVNKTTAEIRAIAQSYGESALLELAKMGGLVTGKDGKPDGMAISEQVKKSALDTIIERAYGKSPQAITGEGGEGPILFQELLTSIDGKTRGIPTSR